MSAKSGWRKRIKVHPAAELFPKMGGADKKALAADIKKNGLRQLPVFFETRRGERFLLDGCNRLDACELAGVSSDTEGKTLREADGVDPFAYVISANIRRRHLTAEQGRELIAKVIALQPQKSDRAIAKEVGKSPSTVAKVRANVQVGHNSTERREASGRKARGRKPGRQASLNKPGTSPSESSPPETELSAPQSSPPAADPSAPQPSPAAAEPPTPEQPESSRLEQWKQLARDFTDEEFTAAKAWWREFTGSSKPVEAA